MSYIQLKTQIDHANREAETDCIAFMLSMHAVTALGSGPSLPQ